jgi:two-component system, NtrC family, response regulator HydG
MTKRVLIVDDDPGMLSVLSDCVRGAEHGCVYEITSRESLTGALAILPRETFDLIVLDLHMSWIGQPVFHQGQGLDLLREIRKRGVTTPVIMKCAQPTTKAEMDAAQSAGAFGWLIVPSKITEVHQLVARALGLDPRA